MSYLEELNSSQRVAVEHLYGPCMVIAGAGSGKTRVLTYRIAYMIEQGIDPFNILALTFTNKAAKEMGHRIGNIAGMFDAKSITMGTFHSVFAKILRFNADRIGFPSNFTIYDTQDSKSLLKDIIKEFNLDDKAYKPSSILGRISSAKNKLISAEMYNFNDEIIYEDKASSRPEIGRIYKAYANRCQKAGAMDFDDLLFFTNKLLSEFPDVLHFYQQKFKYILVDEYQDTNYAQYLIVKRMAAAYENICVVGDDAQSIYSFRGANIENILNFRSDYPDFVLYKLEQNYRSTKNIVEAANSVIHKNREQIHKHVWTENDNGKPITVVRTLTDNEEGRVIGNKIFDLQMAGSNSYNDFAILYRTNKQSRSFEESLRRMNIPYKIYGGISFYQRKEIKDTLSYFRLTANPNDEEALKRVINYPKRGIGKTSIESVMVAAAEHNVSMWEVISNMSDYKLELNGPTRERIRQFVIMIQSFQAEVNKIDAYTLATRITKSSGMLHELSTETEKGREEAERMENLEELMAGIQEFVDGEEDELRTLPDFMIEVALLTDADQDNKEEMNHVSLMTIHASKGLEYPHVFIVGLEENLFPSQMALHTRSELEEERRLFYVAVTRAMTTCTLSYSSNRFIWGQSMQCEPSRFIDEIDTQFVHFENQQRGPAKSLMGSGFENRQTGGLNAKLTEPKIPASLKSIQAMQQKPGKPGSSDQNISVGTNVEHERFGLGKVTQIEGQGPDKKAVIFFPHHGSKTVLLKFANLKVV